MSSTFDFARLELVEKTPGKNEKRRLIGTFDPVEKILARMAIDPEMLFRIKEISEQPLSVMPFDVEELPAEVRFAMFQELAEDLMTKKALTAGDRVQINEFLSKLPPLEFKWYRRVLLKDLRCGFDVTSFNKAFPDDPIVVYGCALAETFEPKHEPAIRGKVADVKLDGVRGLQYVSTDESGVTRSRNGKPITSFPHILAELPKGVPGVFDGEIWMPGENGFQELMRFVKKDAQAPMDLGIRYVMFDFVDAGEWGGDTAPFEERRMLLDALMKETFGEGEDIGFMTLYGKHLAVTKLMPLNNMAEALALLEKVMKQGFEGLMPKDPGAGYKIGRSTNILKMKVFHDLEAEVIDHEPGKGRLADMLGALICALPDKTVFNVGSGFNDAQRQEFWAKRDSLVGRIITVKYQELSKDGVPRFPIFQRFREDVEIGL